MRGMPDWCILFKPGPKARQEYRAFTTRKPSPLVVGIETPDPGRAEKHPDAVHDLVARGVTEARAAELVSVEGEDKVCEKIAHFDWLIANRPRRLKNRAGYLADSIVKDYAAPAGYRPLSSVELAPPSTRSKPEPIDPVHAMLDEVDADPARKAEFNAAAIAHADPADRAAYEKLTRPFDRTLHEAKLRESYARHLLTQETGVAGQYRGCPPLQK